MPSLDLATSDYLARLRELQPFISPGAFYFTGEDHLRIASLNSLASVALSIEGRFLSIEGRIESFAERHVPNTDRTSATSTFSRGEGWLLDVQVRASAAAPRRGQCFVVLEVVRGLTGAIIPLATLLEGYATDSGRLAYPGSPLEASASGAGVLRSITGTNPAAAAEITETVPTNARWRPLLFEYTLVSSSVAANRETALILDDGTNELVHTPSGFAHALSLTIKYSAAHHVPRLAGSQDTAKQFPMPQVTLPGWARLLTVTTNFQAADDYGAPQYLVEEWIED